MTTTTGIGRPVPLERTRRELAARLEVDGRTLWATTHCVERFWERAAVGCTRFADARDRLVALVREIGAFGEPPAWATPIRGRWLALGPDAGLVVQRGRARTCLPRGGRPKRRVDAFSSDGEDNASIV